MSISTEIMYLRCFIFYQNFLEMHASNDDFFSMFRLLKDKKKMGSIILRHVPPRMCDQKILNIKKKKTKKHGLKLQNFYFYGLEIFFIRFFLII